MRALIDSDIILYEYGGMVQLEEPDKPLEWEIVRSMVDDRIKQILEATSADSFSLYLTDSSSNFRVELATILPYKGQRTTEKPYHWAAIRQHLIDNWDAEVQYGIEADDRLGIEQCAEIDLDIPESVSRLEFNNQKIIDFDIDKTVICSRDKDMHMIPGAHYTWPCGNQKERLWFQDETSAIRCFYRQLLTGDAVDNILGLYGVGASSKLVKSLEEMEQEQLMFNHVFKQYKNRFGDYAFMFFIENAWLLWIKREEPAAFPEYEIEQRIDLLLDNMEEQDEEEKESNT